MDIKLPGPKLMSAMLQTEVWGKPQKWAKNQEKKSRMVPEHLVLMKIPCLQGQIWWHLKYKEWKRRNWQGRFTNEKEFFHNLITGDGALGPWSPMMPYSRCKLKSFMSLLWKNASDGRRWRAEPPNRENSVFHTARGSGRHKDSDTDTIKLLLWTIRLQSVVDGGREWITMPKCSSFDPELEQWMDEHLVVRLR